MWRCLLKFLRAEEACTLCLSQFIDWCPFQNVSGLIVCLKFQSQQLCGNPGPARRRAPVQVLCGRAVDTRPFRGSVFFNSLYLFTEASEDEKLAGFSTNSWPFQRESIYWLITETGCLSWWKRYFWSPLAWPQRTGGFVTNGWQDKVSGVLVSQIW